MQVDVMARKLLLSVSTSVLLIAGSALPADAAKRKPAPITFAGDAPDGSEVERPQTRAAETSAPSRRIEFRYPDRPEFSYSEDGVRRLGDDAAPFAFSSSDTAISPEDASRMTVTALPDVARDPALTSGAFDARAAAASTQRMQTAALTPDRSASERAVSYSEPRQTRDRFEPTPSASFSERGAASWYGENYQGKPTASGEIFDQNALTAAHPTLPLPSLIEVTNEENGRKLVLRVNDRGPFVDGRIVDVSQRAAELLGFVPDGTTSVSIRYIGPAGPAAPMPGVSLADRDRAEAPSPVASYDLPAPTVTRTVEAPVRVSAPSYDAEPYLVQIGSFADIGNAQRAYATLARDLPVEIVEARVNGADYFRVVVGPFGGRSKAEEYRDRLIRRGYDGALVRRAN